LSTLLEIVKALLFVGIPVGAFSFLMVYFSYQKGYLSTDVEIQDAFKKKNKIETKLSGKNKKELVFLHSKWITFGGGFYGLIALLTFIVIELLQILNFWLGVTGWHDIFALFSIEGVIGMFIDSIMNMVKAAVWFTYWPEHFNTNHYPAWILMAYIGYRLGGKFAKQYSITQSKKSDNVESKE